MNVRHGIIVSGLVSFLALSSCVHDITGISEEHGVLIVNISARETNKENPVFRSFSAGTWEVRVIGRKEGGLYEAWNPWFWPPEQDDQGTWIKGWITAWTLRSKDLGEIHMADPDYSPAPGEALLGASTNKFSLVRQNDVYFYITDNPQFDNAGGISLAVRQISFPD